MAVQTKYIVIDSNLGLNRKDLDLLEKTLEDKEFQTKKILLLQFSNTNGKVRDVLESFFDFRTIELTNKANSSDIKSVFRHFSTLEGKVLSKVTDKIRFGKKMLYLDAVSNSFIRKFTSNNECPGFWNLAIGTFCNHGCLYCFLNLTMRIRPLCVEHANLSRLESNLKSFNKRYGHPKALLNAGETSDPLDNEPLLHFWNQVVKIVRNSENRILCLTKSANVHDIPEPDGNDLANTVIYSWSINPSPIVHRYEPFTASTEERLTAARHLKELGYRIRFRVDPILPLNLMDAIAEGTALPVKDIELDEYFQLLDKLDHIEPEMITFGTFRALPSLFNFLVDKTFNKQNLVKNGKRFRIARKYRRYIYEKLGYYAQDVLNCRVAICKDPTIELPFRTLKTPCICMDLT